MNFDQRGFSLIEVLVTAAVLVTIGIITAQIMGQIFKGNTKSALIGSIKQNGQQALSIMENDIRNSETVLCTDQSVDNGNEVFLLTLYTRSGSYVRYTIYPEYSLTNGTITKESLDSVVNANTQLTQNPANFCDLSSVPFNSPLVQLINSDLTSPNAVSVKQSTGFSIANKASGFKDVVTVQFDLGPSINANDRVENSIGNATNAYSFQTSVQLR